VTILKAYVTTLLLGFFDSYCLLSGIFGTFTFVRLSGLEDSVFTETEIAAIARKEVETKITRSTNIRFLGS
jgi:hypothetical protein